MGIAMAASFFSRRSEQVKIRNQYPGTLILKQILQYWVSTTVAIITIKLILFIEENFTSSPPILTQHVLEAHTRPFSDSLRILLQFVIQVTRAKIFKLLRAVILKYFPEVWILSWPTTKWPCVRFTWNISKSSRHLLFNNSSSLFRLPIKSSRFISFPPKMLHYY